MTCSSTNARSSTQSTATSAASTSWRWIFDPAACAIRTAGLQALSAPYPGCRGERGGVRARRRSRRRAPLPYPLPAEAGRGSIPSARRHSGRYMLDLFPSRDASRFGRRLKYARGARLPVIVVTGFLGAGKTTLLRRFLASPAGEGTAVVINEFGSVGIDDALVRASTDDVTLLGNGCLCCNMRSDLQNALRNLVAERAHGISSFVITEDAPLPWEAFARGMETLIALRGGDLLRVKGLLNVVGCRGPVVVQVAQHLAHPPVELAAWPDQDRTSRLVFITRGIPERHVRDLFAAVRALSGR